jgi:hypothetical protein
VERVTWIQDPSRHRSDPLDRICRDGLAWQVGCPGDMWRSVPWGVSHHAAFEHWNGALLGGQHVRGDVMFRDNIVKRLQRYSVDRARMQSGAPCQCAGADLLPV